MPRLIRLVFVLLAGLAALTFLVRGAGSTRPEPAFLRIFTNPDGTPCAQPCLFGIRPGVTTYARLIEILDLHPLTRAYSRVQINPDDKIYRQINLVGADVQITFFARGDEPIEFFTVQFMPANWDQKSSQLAPPTVKDLLAVFGQPEGMSLLYYGPSLQIHYGPLLFVNAVMTSSPSRLDPTDPIYLISVARNSQPYPGSPIPWMGFVSYRRVLYR